MTKILVYRLPEAPEKCPYSEYVHSLRGYICRLSAPMGNTYSNCRLCYNEECDRLIAPFTFESEEEQIVRDVERQLVIDRMFGDDEYE